MIDNGLLKEAIAYAEAERQTAYAWCKCGHGCMCSHCRIPMLKWYHGWEKFWRKDENDKRDILTMWFKELMKDYKKWNKEMTKQEVEAIREELRAAFSESYVERFNQMLFEDRIKRELPPEPMTDETAAALDEMLKELEEEG